MNGYDLSLAGATLTALGTGALWWGAERLLCVSDLHLGKSERQARRGGVLLPPYETADTLARLADDIARCRPDTVICLGDSFDDAASAGALDAAAAAALARMRAGRRWIWIRGNHDAGADGHGGTVLDEIRIGPLVFRHIAAGDAPDPGVGEVSGHYHPKAGLALAGRAISRPCFLCDGARLILPAYGTYTGGLRWTDPALQALMRPGAQAVLTGPTPRAFPVPRAAGRRAG